MDSVIGKNSKGKSVVRRGLRVYMSAVSADIGLLC
jgi:hypothetical protein